MPLQILLLRIIHAVFAVYFLACLAYLCYATFTGRYDLFLVISIISLAVEGALVFIFNSGNCPLIHIQKRIGDDKPFFELMLPTALAKKAIPIFALLTLIALLALSVRYIFTVL